MLRYTAGLPSAHAPAAAMTAPATRPHHAIWPKRLPRTLQLPETSLWFNLEVSARRYPDKPAYLFFGQPLRHAELLGQAEALAGWLQAQGVQKGDRVAVFKIGRASCRERVCYVV